MFHSVLAHKAASSASTAFSKSSYLPSLMECEDAELEDMFDDVLSRHEKLTAAEFECDGAAIGDVSNIVLGTEMTGDGNTTAPSSGPEGGSKIKTTPKHNNPTTLADLPVQRSATKRSLASRMRGIALVYRSISSSMDHRLTHGINTRVEIALRRLTLMSSMNLFVTFPSNPQLLPAVRNNNNKTPSGLTRGNLNMEMPAAWPEHVLRSWPDEDYKPTSSTVDMLAIIFEELFAAMPMPFTWLNVEQVLHLWLTINYELSDRTQPTTRADRDAAFLADAAASTFATVNPTCTGHNHGSKKDASTVMAFHNLREAPKIPFGRLAIDGMLQMLCTEPANSLRTWYLSFQCLIMACNPTVCCIVSGIDNEKGAHAYASIEILSRYIIENPLFERMLVHFYSSTDNFMTAENRNVSVNKCFCVGRYVYSLYKFATLLYDRLGWTDNQQGAARALHGY